MAGTRRTMAADAAIVRLVPNCLSMIFYPKHPQQLLLELPNPNIAKAHRIAMVLQAQRRWSVSDILW